MNKFRRREASFVHFTTLKVLIPAQGVQKRKAGIQRFKASLSVKANTVLITKQQQNKLRLV